jgi:hypothetical protein
VTREQIIVLGFIAAAFVVGWALRALLGWWERERTAAQAELARIAEPPPADTPLTDEVGDALGRDAANDSMLSVVPTNGEPPLTEVELDLTDWGFTYGVAWARARERSPDADDDAIAAEALRAAEDVFRAYTGDGDWTRHIDARRLDQGEIEGVSSRDPAE